MLGLVCNKLSCDWRLSVVTKKGTLVLTPRLALNPSAETGSENRYWRLSSRLAASAACFSTLALRKGVGGQ
jgi:hypothetical protein